VSRLPPARRNSKRPQKTRFRRLAEGGAGTGRGHGRAPWFTPTALALFGMAILGASCGTLSSRLVSDPAPAVARLTAGATIHDEVDRLAQPLIDTGDIYGIAVGVLTSDGSIRTYGYGRTGRPGDVHPPGGDTIFQVGSVSKVFGASLLAILVDEGTLRYEDTVRSILPADIPLSADAGALTLYDLVTNTGGLPRSPHSFTALYYFLRYLFTGTNLYGYITQPYLYQYLRTWHRSPTEHRRYVYSNVGAALLAHLIEVNTKRPFPELVDEKISRPLNMHDTVFTLTAEQHQRLAVGHVGDQPRFMWRNTPLEVWDMGKIMQASGGLYSTVDDLMIFAKSHLGLLHHPLDPLMASTHRVQVTTSTGDVALGWLISVLDEDRVKIIYMHGMVSGYDAYIGMDAGTQSAVVVLCNSFNWDDRIGHNLLLRLSGAVRGMSGRGRGQPE
jgi:CubicO group peptidase (beta-lactamase class C family)